MLLFRGGVLNLFHLHTPCVLLELFVFPYALNFLIWRTSNIIICIPLYYNLHTPESLGAPTGTLENKYIIIEFPNSPLSLYLSFTHTKKIERKKERERVD